MNAIKRKMQVDFLQDSEIQEKIQEILHPYLSTKDPVIAIQFGVPKDGEDEWREAIGFASAYTTYRASKIGRLTRPRVEFRTDQA
ncbi:MAG TPA: hypothetical protein VLR94_10870, partial [Acidobacteriota bacterium]|nr:hypothetical protein [Acidobacteriota bacterium]